MSIEVIEALIWLLMPLVLVSFLLYFIGLLRKEVSKKKYYIFALLAGFLGALLAPGSLCQNTSEIILGTLFFSFWVFFSPFCVVFIAILFRK